MKRTITIFCLILLCSVVRLASEPYALVLGTAQDAGAPQIGCMSAFCNEAWKDARKRQKVSSIALVDPDSGRRWIFDATPDLPAQLQLLKKQTKDYSNRIDGIFLTHAHIGHYTGLMYLGRESMNAEKVPVYAMPRMMHMLENNAPWSQLVSLKNIEIRSLRSDGVIDLAAGISVRAFEVPHRDEFSETVGFRIDSGAKSLIFLPDIDKWSKWEKRLEDLVEDNDYVLVDGTFYADGEIPRPISEVPHPFVSETVELLKSLSPKQKAKVHFIHFNHSNPLIQGNKEKLKELKDLGFRIAFEGLVLGL